MDEIRRAALVTQCAQAVMRFYAALDAGDFAAVAAGMAPDGVWHRQGKALLGPPGVAAALAERPAGRATAHLVQNLVIDLEGEDGATARYMSLVYRNDGHEGKPPPYPLAGPLSIALYADRMRRDAEGDWLVVERRSRRLFGG
jgi:ketosteroid isomerase-like protein